MAKYRYNAEDESGQRTHGELEAADREEALRLLRQQGLQKPQLTEGRPGKLSNAESDDLTQIIAELSDSNLPLAAGFRAASSETGSHRLSRVLRSLASRMEEGVPLQQAIDDLGPAIPEHVAGLVTAAVQSNNVSQVLMDIIDLRIRVRDTWSSALTSLAYPTFALFFGAVLFVLFSVYVATPFCEMYEDFSLALPMPTRVLVWWNEIGGWMLASVLLMGPMVAIFTPMIFGTPRYRRMLSSLPIIGVVFYWMGVAEMARLLALMIDNSIPLPRALGLTAAGIRDANIREMCRDMARQAEAGQTLTQIAATGNTLPMAVIPLVRWGERTQRLPEALRNVANLLENRVQTRATLLRIAYPPIVFLIIFIGLAFAVVSLYLPLASLLGGFY